MQKLFIPNAFCNGSSLKSTGCAHVNEKNCSIKGFIFVSESTPPPFRSWE